MAQSENLPSKQPQQLPSETVEKMIALQSEQVKLQYRQMELQSQSLKEQTDIAKAQIVAKTTENDSDIKYLSSESTKSKVFAFAVITSMIGLVILLVLSGRDAIALDIIKTVGTFAAGALSGYGYSKVKGDAD